MAQALYSKHSTASTLQQALYSKHSASSSSKMEMVIKTRKQQFIVTILVLYVSVFRNTAFKRAILKLARTLISHISTPRHALDDNPVPTMDFSLYARNVRQEGVWSAAGVYSMGYSTAASDRWINIGGKRKWIPNTHYLRSVIPDEWRLTGEFYRPINDTRSDLIHKIITYGQPCRLMCVLEKSGAMYRVKIEIEPLEGWQPLCHSDDIRPWQYHISLGTITVGTYPLPPNFVPVDNFDFWADWKEVIKTFHNKVHYLKIERVSRNFTMMLSETDSIQQNAAVGRLRDRDRGHSLQLSVSA